MPLKLGKKPASNRVTFKLKNLINPSALPKPPKHFGHEDFIGKSDWGMLANDTVGNCFSGDTKIPLTNGTEVTIKELSEQYNEKAFWVYSCNETGKITPGLASKPQLTRKNAAVLAITLDNGEVIKCTHDHLFMLRDGSYTEAKNLSFGTSLMPLYRKLDRKGYEMCFNPASNTYKHTHTLMAEGWHGDKPISNEVVVVHHINLKKRNNDPTNLRYMTWSDHSALHSTLTQMMHDWVRSEEGKASSRRNIEKTREGFKKWVADGNKTGFALWDADKFKNSRPDPKKIGETKSRLWKEDENFRQKMLKVALSNLKRYNEGLASGEIKFTEKQKIECAKARDKARERGSALWNDRKKSSTCLLCGNTYKVISNTHLRDKHNITINDYINLFPSEKDSIVWNKNLTSLSSGVVNHKVASVEDAGFEDVYDFTVDTHHNFALSAGVFVHNCVFAGAAHETMLWNAECGKSVKFSDESVLSDYSAVTGYNPNDPNSDSGTDMSLAASYRRKTGIIDANGVRHQIAAYVSITPGDVYEHYIALYLFGSVGIGIEFPASAMTQINAGKPWSVVRNSPIEGGHYINLVAKRTRLECVTWGQIQGMTTGFFKKYNDESLAYISSEMLTDKKSPEGFDYDTLVSMLNQLSK